MPAVIVSAVRIPTGKFLGALKGFTAPQLGALVVREAVARAGIEPGAVDECLMGNVVQAGAGDRLADDERAELGGGEALERAQELAGGHADGGDDDGRHGRLLAPRWAPGGRRVRERRP